MKILVIGKFYSEGFALHIAETLTGMGHTAERFEPGLRVGRFRGKFGQRFDQVRGLLHSTTDNLVSVRQRRFKPLLRQLDQGQFDSVLCCHDFLWPDEVEQIKARAGSVALWFPDHVGVFGRAYFMNAPYDALFFKDPYIVRRLSGVVESPVYYLPECCNPEKHSLPDGVHIDHEYVCDITTAGNQHSYRAAFLKHLAEYDVKLWGNTAPIWMRAQSLKRMYQGRPVLNHEKASAFRGAKIVINNLHYAEVEGVNVRTFEAACAGGFQLVDWRSGLSQLFEDGIELVTFGNLSELIEKIEFYLPRQQQRVAIARAGAQRALREHTYCHRLTLLIDTLAGKSTGFPMPAISSYATHCEIGN